MFLNKREEDILEGEEGPSKQKSMEILVELGEIYDANKLIDIKSAQVSGVSYKTIGDAGLEFIKDIASTDEEVEVKTTLNPAGIDIEKWKELGISRDFAEKQMQIIDLFEQIGIETSCSCTPYLIGNKPKKGEHVAWAESSAVSYCNSVLGARTNREGGPSALASALIGKTPNYGYHLDRNREADYSIRVEEELSRSDYGSLGKIVGKKVEDSVPYFNLKSEPNKDELKALGASMAATGAVALYHVDKITPEYKETKIPDEEIVIEKEEIKNEFNKNLNDVDLIAIGCPHLSNKELQNIYKEIEDKEIKKKLWVFTARKTSEKNKKLISKLEEKGVKVVMDTCMVVSPLREIGINKVMVDSGKASFYLPSLNEVDAVYSSTEKCLKEATRED
ncbi:MAG: putative aconitase [Candidatus Methanohalarchaeum thermophilum]|uniref:Phosphomevalonate dehydratase large subunit n=1 Tax=Methanohalarchaeum thermophilum TaxID=1903181 RepID=A0A1Q6DXR9_METT1|nr:MAG: putative aconitase [Candidatus Methanohalarchaeum thermophilum]